MEKDILIESDHGRRQMAVVEDGKLREIYTEQDSAGKCQGCVYLGRVVNVLPGMQAAFVDIGLEKNAFLSLDDVPVDKADMDGDMAAKLRTAGMTLKNGQELIVQVVKDPGGEKGSRISCHVTLPGRYVVLLPSVEYVGVSHKIEDGDERTRLRAAAENCRREGMGLIVRTAAMDAEEAEIQKDVGRMTDLWSALQEKARYNKAPALLYGDENLACRAVRDMLGSGVRVLEIDDEALYRQAQQAARVFAPDYEDRVRLYSQELPLFDARQVRRQIQTALDRKVWLKSGAYLVMDFAEALTVIDVNTGKNVGKNSLSDTVFQVNCEAADEIARQLRLRDVGGIIVIDFIDMDTQEQKDELLCRLRLALKDDPSKVRVVGLTGLGLVEMTRKRAQQSLKKQLCRPCPLCGGMGEILNEETQTHEALLTLRAVIARQKADAYLMEAPRAIADRAQNLGGVPGAEVWIRTGAEVKVTPCLKRDIPKDARKLG